jgi:hypothetical protein
MEYVKQMDTMYKTGEEESETEEEMEARIARKEQEEDDAYDNFVN